MSRRIKGNNNNYLIVESDSEFFEGLLFPYNITYHGEEVSLPFSIGVFNQIISDNELLNGLTVLSSFGDKNQYAILGFDFEKIQTSVYLGDELVENVMYDAQIISKNN